MKESFSLLPGAWVIPLRHTVRGERQIQSLGLTGDDFERGRAREPFGGSRRKSVGAGGKIERDTAAHHFQKVTFHDCNGGVGGREGNFQFAGSGFQRGIRSSERYGSADNEVFLELAGLESLFAQFDGMVSGIDGGDGERAIGLNGADESLIDENRGSGSAALDGQRGQARLRLEVEDKPGLFALANADLLLGRILKAALGDLYNVVLELEIRQAQLAGLSELRLKFSVEKNSCVVLTGNDEERAQVVTGLRGRLIGDRYRSGGGVGRNGKAGRDGSGRCWCGRGDSAEPETLGWATAGAETAGAETVGAAAGVFATGGA